VSSTRIQGNTLAEAATVKVKADKGGGIELVMTRSLLSSHEVNSGRCSCCSRPDTGGEGVAIQAKPLRGAPKKEHPFWWFCASCVERAAEVLHAAK
jgi:hypothetical protein